jgi:hypothetical protein
MADETELRSLPVSECLVCGNDVVQSPRAAPRRLCEVCSRRQKNARQKVYAHIQEMPVAASTTPRQLHDSPNQLTFNFGFSSLPSTKPLQPNDTMSKVKRSPISPIKLDRHADGRIIGLSFGPCPKCGRATILKENFRTCASFLGCSGYPSCRWRG